MNNLNIHDDINEDIYLFLALFTGGCNDASG